MPSLISRTNFDNITLASVSFGTTTYVPLSETQGTPKSRFHMRLKSFVDGVGRVRTLVLDVLFLFLLVFLILFAIYLTISEQRLIIEPIHAPKKLASIGYTNDVAANRLVDAILEVESSAKFRQEKLGVIPQSRSVKIEIPEIGTLFDTALNYSKRLFSRQDVIVTGEFICSMDDCDATNAQLRIRILVDGQPPINLPPIYGEEANSDKFGYFNKAAVNILEKLDPLIAAAYLHNRDPDRAAAIVRRVLLRKEGSSSDLALANNIMGVMRLHEGDYQGAESHFKEALHLDANLVEAQANWGNALLAQQKPDEAIQKYLAALAIDPNYAPAQANIGDANLRKNQIEQAIDAYEAAIELDRNLAYAYANLGEAHSRRADEFKAKGEEKKRAVAFDLATKNFRAAIDFQDDLIFAHVSLANAHIRQDNLELAKAAFDAARMQAELNDIPNRKGALAYIHASLGDLYMRDKSGDAIAEYRSALRYRSDNPQALVGLADALLRRKKYDEAILYFKQAIAKKGDFARAHIGLGEAYLAKGEDHFADSMKAFKLALDSDQGSFRANIGLGDLAFKQQNYRDAVAYFQKAISANKKSSQAHAGFGAAQLKIENFKSAKTAYQTALKLRPGVAYRYADLGVAHSGLKEWEDAAINFKKATDLSPESVWIYRHWIDVLRQSDNSEEVPMVLERWSNAEPDGMEPRYLLVKSLAKLKRHDEALAAWQAVLSRNHNESDVLFLEAQAEMEKLENASSK